MNSSSKKNWRPSRNDEQREVGLVQIDIGGRGDEHDPITNLVLKRAKDALKDALIKSAAGRRGTLSSWEDDGGTFTFPIEGPDSVTNCCKAAIEMLVQLPLVKREEQLAADLEPLLMIRIVCDTGTVSCDPEGRNLPGEFAERLKQHEQVVSAENKVTITERIFRSLDLPLKATFVKWKHSTELDVDLYTAGEAPLRVGPSALSPGELPPVQGWWAGVSGVLKSRTVLASFASGILLALILFGLVRIFAWPTKPPGDQATVPSAQGPGGIDWKEQVQSKEWLSWRKQIHEKLSAGEVTESTLAEALKIKLPARPDYAAAALRRDQAVADVLMSYPSVRKTLETRFGIYEQSFLGTGLSKPNTMSDYGGASVHEYLIPNFGDDHPAVWMRILDPFNNPMDMTTMTMTVQELFKNDLKPDDRKSQLVNALVERVMDKDTANPAMIRFARLDLSKYAYSRKLGRPNAYRVFMSNLAEVWNTPVKDAANLSGYQYADGEKVYVWAFLPNYPLPNKPGEVVPATWNAVLNNLPKWLSDNDKN